LCSGLFVSDAPPFEHWLDGERRRLCALVVRSGWAAAQASQERRHAGDVARYTRFAVSLSEFDESAIRRAMHLLAGVGERAAALGIYEQFAAKLKSELNVEPSAPTRLIASDLRTSEPAASPVVIDQLPRLPAPPNDDLTGTVARERGEWLVDDPHPALDHTESRGRRRLRWRMPAAAAAAALALVVAARLAPSASMALDPRRVRVEMFVNQSGDPRLDSLATRATFDARDAVVRLENVMLVAPETGDARDDRAGTIIRGRLRLEGDALEMHADVIDRAAGTIVRAIAQRFPVSPPDRSMDRAAFIERLRAAVATALYPGWGTALSQPPSYGAYRLFVDGMRSIKLERHDAALAGFRRAFDEDSTFTAAGLLAAMELYQLKRFAAAESVVAVIGSREETLPEVDRHLLEWMVRSLQGDHIGARAEMEAITRVAPSAELAWLQLAIDNVETARPREALDALDHIDRSSDFGEGWASYWATRIEALHLLGDHTRELAVAREGLHRHPDLKVLANYELRALAALGRTGEIGPIVRSLRSISSDAGFDAPLAMRQAALELAAHGHPDLARDLLQQTLAWYGAQPEVARRSLSQRLGYARTLYLADVRGDARAIYDSLLREYPSCLDCVGAIGVLAARDRDIATARANSDTLARVSGRFLFGRSAMWRSRIAAAGGDADAATALVQAAFSSGAEFNVMTHTDADLLGVRVHPDSIYRRLVRAER
jgi:hypothetical protein